MDCEDDACQELCTHIREDNCIYDPDAQYIYKVSYLGDYCVLTATIPLMNRFVYKTMAIRVGAMSLGEVTDGLLDGLAGHYIDRSETPAELIHYKWDGVLNAHETALIMLNSGMLIDSE